MDVLLFLKERTRFIRFYFETADRPFREIIRKIEASEAPYDNPPFDDSGEPPFLEEWEEAAEARDVLGRSCVSMLNGSLSLYFQTWEAELRVVWEPGERNRVFKMGMVQGYQRCFGELLNIKWDECPADFAVIEQITLARNRDQHPEHIASIRVTHSRDDREKYPNPFFMSDYEKNMFADPSMRDSFFMDPAISVNRETLFAAIEQVERLADWLEPKFLTRRYGPREEPTS